ncbi:MAG: AccI family restriction endonuclease [Thermodesulfobacteriaceae bacterium]
MLSITPINRIRWSKTPQEHPFPCKETPPLKLPRPPAVASEAFLSTIAQGMWAEEKIIEAVNSTTQFFAIRYGQSRYDGELISKKDAWKNYVTRVYTEMSKYGKRPDVLIFKKDGIDIKSIPPDISEKPEDEIRDIVFKSLVGFEVRSSSYYYEEYVKARGKEDKELSITVKEEDIERILKWRNTYCGLKPIYYVQIFFDKGFYISFDEILNIIERAKITKVKHYRKEKDRKTGKLTHFIGINHAKLGLIAEKSPTLTAKSIKAWDGKVYAIRMPMGGVFKLTNEFIQELISLTAKSS